MKCQVCQSPQCPDALDMTYRCSACGFFSSALPVEINEVHAIDEGARESALFPLREAGFRQILDDCKGLIKEGGSILDVGCAHGWFIQAAQARGYRCHGIEPDDDMATKLDAAKITFSKGFFPDILQADQTYDAITFHDVFEHLPDLAAVVTAARNHLNPGGLLIISLPMSDGIFFKIARGLATIGISGPLSRMWQKGLPSPHLSYFSRTTLPQLILKFGFDLRLSRDLPSVSTKGLYDRIRYDKEIGPIKAAILFVAARALVPITKMTASDSRYFVFRKTLR